MKKLTWWFRIGIGFYLLSGVMNLYGTFIDPALFASNLPYPATYEVVRAFIAG